MLGNVSMREALDSAVFCVEKAQRAHQQRIAAMGSTRRKFRDELERLIIGELHGPCQGEQEKFRGERPQDRYLVGLLAPKFIEIGQEHDEGTGSRDGGTASDDGLGLLLRGTCAIG